MNIFERITDQDTLPIIISSIALLLSSISLLWNILKHFLSEKMSLLIKVQVGSFLDNSEKFIISASERPILLKDAKIFYLITNNGKKNIYISKIIIEYKKKAIKNNLVRANCSMLLTKHLPKKLEPYETVIENSADKEKNDYLKNDYIKKIYVVDSKNKKWKISKNEIRKALTNMKNLKEN